MEKNLLLPLTAPAGAGKSTVGKTLAARLSYVYLDTGALYRALAYKVIRKGFYRVMKRHSRPYAHVLS